MTSAPDVWTMALDPISHNLLFYKGAGDGGLLSPISGVTDLVFCPNSEKAYLSVGNGGGTRIWRSNARAENFEESFVFDLGLPSGYPNGGGQHLAVGPSCELYAYGAKQPIVVYRNEAPLEKLNADKTKMRFLPWKALGKKLKMSYGDFPHKLQFFGGSSQHFVFSGSEDEVHSSCYETTNGGTTFLAPRPCATADGIGGGYAIVPGLNDTQFLAPDGTREHNIFLYTPSQPDGVRRSDNAQRRSLKSVGQCIFDGRASAAIAIAP